MTDQSTTQVTDRSSPLDSVRADRLLALLLALLLAFVAAFFVYETWGGLDRPGIFHDEKAYLLQARIYADLKWTEPTPPVPSLWEQVHVFVEPHYASRYPPGFPAVLAIGAAFGVPGLIPVLLTGATAALLFLFGSKLFGRWTAFVATALWAAAPLNTEWRATYLSESLTGFLWVAWCWCAWRYRREGRRRDLVVTSLLVAFAGITRPVTAMALALPLPFVFWPRLRTAAGRRDATVAIAAGLVICSIVPVWNRAVLDSWTTTPYAEYSARTFPFDMPNLRVDWSPPPREIPPDHQALADEQRRPYERRTVAGMPREYWQRLKQLGGAAIPYELHELRYLAPLGLLAAGGVGLVALASALLLLLAHITMPHSLNWTIYYLDVFPVVAFGAVIALARAGAVARDRLPSLARLRRFLPGAALAAGLALLAAGGTRWAPQDADNDGWMHREIFFRSGLCALPPGRKMVFVKPRLGSSPHHILVDNDPRWDRSDAWIVRAWDTPRHVALMAAAPDRQAYYYDEKSGWFSRMNRDGTVEPEGVIHVVRADHSKGRGIRCR